MNYPQIVLGSLLLTEIKPSSLTKGRKLADESLTELVESIRRWGVIEDVIVRPIPEPGKKLAFDGRRWSGLKHFEIVIGERRLRAAKLAGLREIGVKVMALTDEDARLIRRDIEELTRTKRKAVKA